MALFDKNFGVETRTYLVVKVIENGGADFEFGIVIFLVDHFWHVKLVIINEIAVDPKAYFFNIKISRRLCLGVSTHSWLIMLEYVFLIRPVSNRFFIRRFSLEFVPRYLSFN